MVVVHREVGERTRRSRLPRELHATSRRQCRRLPTVCRRRRSLNIFTSSPPGAVPASIVSPLFCADHLKIEADVRRRDDATSEELEGDAAQKSDNEVSGEPKGVDMNSKQAD